MPAGPGHPLGWRRIDGTPWQGWKGPYGSPEVFLQFGSRRAFLNRMRTGLPNTSTRRKALGTLAGALASPFGFPRAAEIPTGKKGWAGASAEFHRTFGVHWYYTWGPKGMGEAHPEFVPMLKGPWHLNPTPDFTRLTGARNLLGSNEKDHHKFLKDSLRFLERNEHVERYAYFNPGPGKPHSLAHEDGSPTRLGELYREA